MELFYHIFNFAQTIRRQIGVFRREETETFISPVIILTQTAVITIAPKGMHRQKFNRADAEPAQVSGNGSLGKAPESSPLRIFNKRVQRRIPFQMRFINDCLFIGNLQRAVPLPVIIIFGDNHAFGNKRRAVEFGKRQVFFGTVRIIAEQSLIPYQAPGKFTGIRIKQQLVRIETMSL